METRMIAPQASQKLNLLGFMNEDVIYGIVLDGDTLPNANGYDDRWDHRPSVSKALTALSKKEYHQDGLYIAGVTVGNDIDGIQPSCRKTAMLTKLSKKTIS